VQRHLLRAGELSRLLQRSVETEKGEQGPRTSRVIAPDAVSWYFSITLTLSLRIVCSSSTQSSGGNPPRDSPRDIEPRQAWKRTPISFAAAI
jgi:hypothetical protein